MNEACRRRSPHSTEKIGDLCKPGFYLTVIRKHSAVFSSKANTRSVVRRSANEGSCFRDTTAGSEIGRIDARSCGTTPRPAIEYQRDGRGPLDCLGQTIGRVLQSQKLFAILEGAFNRPTIGVCCQDLPGVPIKLGAVEHLIGAFSLQVMYQDDRQLAVSTCLVVESLDRFDGERGMQPELVEFEFESRAGLNPWPTGPCRQPGPFLSRRSLAPFLLDGSTLVKRTLGMNVADEVNVGRQMREDALAPVGAVAGEDDLIVRIPLATKWMSSRASSGRVR